MFNLLITNQNKSFRRLWFAQLISQFGDRVHQMALVGLVFDRFSGSSLALAKLMAFSIIPVFLIGPVAGVFVDRWDRRTILFVCDFVRTLLVLSIPTIFIYRDSMVPIYIVVFLAFCFSRFYVPAKLSIIPDIVDDKNLLSANSLMTTTGMIALILGAICGGFIVEKMGTRSGFVFDAATFFISGMLIVSIPPRLRITLNRTQFMSKGKEAVHVFKQSFWEELRGGLHYLITNRDIRFIINMMFVLLCAAGAVYVVLVVFIQKTFGTITQDLGLLAVFLGIGLFGGVIGYGSWGKRFVWYKTIFFCMMTGGAMLIVFAYIVSRFPIFGLAALLALVLGLFIGPIFVAANTMAQKVSLENMRGKVFTAIEIVIHFAFLTAMLVSSLVADYIGEQWILIIVGVCVLVIGIVGFWQCGGNPDLALSE